MGIAPVAGSLAISPRIVAQYQYVTEIEAAPMSGKPDTSDGAHRLELKIDWRNVRQ